MVKKKKEKVPEDTPVERIEYFSMKMADLKKFAVKVGKEIGETRKERYELETDRDNLVHYWSNAVYQLMKVERDVRRLERETIHKKNLAERGLVQREQELLDARHTAVSRLAKAKDGGVARTFDKIRRALMTERAVLGDRLRLRGQLRDASLQSDVAIMRMKQRARCQNVDRIILAHKDALLDTVDEMNSIFDGLYDRMEAEAEEQFSRVILLKNKKIHDLRKEHDRNVEDIQKNFEEFRQNDMINEYRKQILNCKEEVAILGNEAEKVCNTHTKCLTSYKVVQEILKELKKLEPSFYSLEEIVYNLKEEYKNLDEKYSYLSLEFDEMESDLQNRRESNKHLWKISIKQITLSRQVQIKIHLAVQALTRMLSEEIFSKDELLARYNKTKGRNFMPLFDLYNRFRGNRLCLQEILDRALRACGSNLAGLGLTPPEDFLRRVAPRTKLPPLPALARAPARRPRLEWAFHGVRLRPAFFRRPPSARRSRQSSANNGQKQIVK